MFPVAVVSAQQIIGISMFALGIQHSGASQSVTFAIASHQIHGECHQIECIYFITSLNGSVLEVRITFIAAVLE